MNQQIRKQGHFFRNVRILLFKNIRIQLIQYKPYLTIYLSPLIILLIMILYQQIANINYNWQKPNPQQYALSNMPLCIGQDCKTLAYSIVGQKQQYMQKTINYVKQANNLTDSDVEYWDKTPQQIMSYLAQNPNKTQVIVIFCSSAWQVGNYKVPCYADNYHLNFYTIVYNLSLFFRTPYLGNLKQSYPKDKMVLRLKQTIDQGIIKYYLKNNVSIKLTDFPSKSNRYFSGINIVAQYGSFFFLLPYLIMLLVQVSTLLKQKQNQLRIGLIVAGVSTGQFYFSNFIMALLNNSIITFSFCVFGYVLGFNFFTQGLLWFDYLVLCSNGFLMAIIGFFVVSLVDQKKMGMSVTYGFVLSSIFMQQLFTGGFLIELLYQKSNSFWINMVKFLFNLYPSFHYSKIFSDIEREADSHFSQFEGRWIKGTEFTISKLFQSSKGFAMVPEKIEFEIPSPFTSYINLLLTSLVYLVLIWYCDNVISSNRGKGDNPFFFFSRRYWTKMLKRRSQNSQNNLRVEVRNVQKQYKKYYFTDSKQDVYALKGASFEVEKNQIVSLLGKNGAGKTTLMGVLTGIVDLSGGAVQVCNMSVQNNIQQIREKLGVCPQFEILWQELSPYQHLKIYGVIKGVQNLEEQIQRSLKDVKLTKHKHGQIKTFSGGMKRRVSLAIAFLGNPEVIILDEPTTGMDPKIRKQTWNIIQKLKKDKSIIITTHNMEEADCLSDRIMIMSSGKILAQGTSLALKNEFGSGYKVRIVTSDAAQLTEQLTKQGFLTSIQDSDVILKSENENELIKILEYLQMAKSEIIKEWLISESTLQEVFLQVNKRY